MGAAKARHRNAAMDGLADGSDFVWHPGYLAGVIFALF
jgi:hypothetical protein